MESGKKKTIKLYDHLNKYQGQFAVDNPGPAPWPRVMIGNQVFVLRKGTKDCYEAFAGPQAIFTPETQPEPVKPKKAKVETNPVVESK